MKTNQLISTFRLREPSFGRYWPVLHRLASVAIVVAFGAVSQATAQQVPQRKAPAPNSAAAAAAIERSKAALDKDVNDTTVGVVSGTVSGTYVQFASDLSAVLDEPGKMRVLAILGKGSVKNIEDVLYVKGVDIGIVQSDVLTFLEKTNLYGGSQNKLQYITRLYNEEFHVLAKEGITRIEDLAGKKVNFGPQGGGAAMTASIIFDQLNIKVEPVHDDPALAIEKLKRDEVSAAIGVWGKPAKLYSGIKAQDGLRFIPIPVTPAVAKTYFPSALTSKDYPDLIPPDGRIPTLAVGSVMVAFGHPKGTWRYNKVARFVDIFFSRIEDFQKAPRHPKWLEVNLSSPVPGWTRFPAADEWLKKAPPPSKPDQAATLTGGSPANLEAFRQFLSERGNAQLTAEEQQARQKLFRAFQEWQTNSTGKKTQ